MLKLYGHILTSGCLHLWRGSVVVSHERQVAYQSCWPRYHYSTSEKRPNSRTLSTLYQRYQLIFPWFVEIDSCFFGVFFQVRKYLIPDSNDEIRQEQMREMELLTTAQTAPNLSPNTSKNPLSVTNSDGQDDIGSDETGSNSSAQVRKSS